MILVLAEKPSAMRNFAKALGGDEGSYNGESYRLCALRGHTRGLKFPEQQVPKEKQDEMKAWSLDRLPWDLSEFAWRKGTLPGCKEVLENLKESLDGIDEVAIATDDDPSGEGEVLAWEALEFCRWHGKTTRMYFPDEAPASVQKAFKNRVAIESMEKDGDYVKGHLRERWDFASMQFVRAATVIAREKGYRTVVRQGRLKSVMVQLVGKQLEAYNSYKRKPFYEARFKDANSNTFARKVDDPADIRFEKKEDVDLSALHASAVVEDSRVAKHTAPGKLLDLAGLSAILAKQGFKPESVLATYQKMYEAQVVSYPRTEDKEITPEQFSELLPLAPKIAKAIGVDVGLLTHTQPRKTHVKEGGAHGANRPGINVPSSLEELKKYGKEAMAIYEILARNYLAMLCEDYEYELVKGHVADFPEYIGETRVPIPGKSGFKAVFDSAAQESDEEESECKDFGPEAEPYVHEGANQRPQKPTMKWLNKKLEKYNVGTGATRTSTLAEISKAGQDASLLSESKGVLKLTKCGEVSYALQEGCRIADPLVTEELFKTMDAAGKFETDPEAVLSQVADMVQHDIQAMQGNAHKLDSMDLGGAAKKPVVGKCPRCGLDVHLNPKTVRCSSIKYGKDEKGNWITKDAGCGFQFYRSIAHKTLTEPQIKKLLEDGITGTINGFKKTGGGTFSAKVTLDKQEPSLGFCFDGVTSRKGSAKRKR